MRDKTRGDATAPASAAPDGSLEPGSDGRLKLRPRGRLKASSCFQTAAGHELLSLPPSVHRLPALASAEATLHIRRRPASCSPSAFACARQHVRAGCKLDPDLLVPRQSSARPRGRVWRIDFTVNGITVARSEKLLSGKNLMENTLSSS